MRLSEEKQALVIHLRLYTDLNLADIAKEVGTSRGTVQRICESFNICDMGRRNKWRKDKKFAPPKITFPLLSTRDASIRMAIRNYRQGAKRRGIPFNLTEKECTELFDGRCYYCGSEPQSKNYFLRRRTPSPVFLNGIDRLDSSAGYVTTNCVSCCKFCNYAKRDFSVNEFLSWIDRIIKYRQEKNNG